MSLTQAQEQLLHAAREAACELGQKGRAPTSLIGELSACKGLNLTWEPSDGYDAKDSQVLYQVKTRHSESTLGVNPRGRLGRFGRKNVYSFDVGLYVALDREFNVVGIWKMNSTTLKALEDRESGSRGLHVYAFVRNAERAFMS